MPRACRQRREGGTRSRALATLAILLALVLAGGCSASEPSGTGTGGATDRPTAPSAAPESTAPPSGNVGATIFGSNVWQEPGESPDQALARIDATYGPVPIARVFSAWMPPSWQDLQSEFGHRELVVSFRLRPSKVLAGEFDEELAAWFAAAPRDRDTYWAFYHEPEDETERGTFTADAFRDAWSHVAQIADSVDNPRLRATLILMCWTAADQSGRDWRDFVPDDGAVDVLAWDCYAKGHDASTYADTAALLEPARAASAEVGADWAIGELGARVMPGDDGHDRAAWLTQVGEYALTHDARFVAYFDAPIGGEFRLTDQPSIAAWAALVDG